MKQRKAARRTVPTTLTMTQAAERQLEEMPARFALRVFDIIKDPTRMEFSKVIGPAPGAGDLVRYKAGTLRLLVAVDGEDGLILGFGVRQPGNNPVINDVRRMSQAFDLHEDHTCGKMKP